MTIRFIFFFLLCTTFLTAQSPYELNWKQETAYLGLGLAMEGFDLYQQTKVTEALTLEEVAALDRNSVNGFDRSATFNSSQQARGASDVFLISSYSAPLLFLAGKKTRKEWGKVAILYFETAIITTGFTGVTKDLVQRVRPISYNDDFEIAERLEKQNRYSFFSGHVSTTSSNCFFAAKVFSDYYPDSKFKPYIWGAAATIPAVTGFLRVKAGKHFPTDVITGYLVGGAFGILIPHLHKTKKGKTLSIAPTPTGFYLSKMF